MKKYETPELETIYFETEDIITTSPTDPGQGEVNPGGDDW